MQLTTYSTHLSVSRKVALNLWLALTYVMASNMGHFFLNYNASFSPIWPPSGLALALALVFGFRHVILGIVLGSLLNSYLMAAPLSTTMGMLVGNLIEPISATLLIQFLSHGKFSFRRPFDVCCFIVVGAFLAPMISNCIYLISFYYGGHLRLEQLPIIGQEWFMSTAVGVLLFTPFTLSFFTKSNKRFNIHEALILFFSITVGSYWAFEGDLTRKFIFVPFLSWAALRFSYRGVSLAAAIVGTMAIWKSAFANIMERSLSDVDLLWIQLLVMGMAILGYFLATVMAADERAVEKEMELSINLKHKALAEEVLAVLDQALNNSPTGFALIDRDYKFIRVNETFAELNGIPAKFHFGRYVKDILPQVAPLIEKNVQKIFDGAKPKMNISFSSPSPKNPQAMLRGTISYYPIKHPVTSDILGIGVSIQDLTAQLQTERLLEENKERLNFAHEAGQIGAFEWDLKNNKIIASPHFELIYELDVEELEDARDLMKWTHPDDVSIIAKELQRVTKEGYEFSLQFRIITKNRNLKWVLARGKVIRDSFGLDLKMIGIVIDISEQKNIEHKLRLTEANLLHALATRDEFMAIASHELKTPLTSLKLQNQLYQRTLFKDEGVLSPAKIATLLDKNSRQIDRLTRLVDDMLDISRIRTGKLTVKKELCELSSIFNDVLHRTREQFIASGSGEPIIEQLDKITGEWDVMRIEQVILNIITNAIRYGKGRPISVSLKNFPEHAQICVKDQGLGITKSDQLKIFERFERGLLAREVSGLGLGLFISQQIIEAHGGKIWVESEINEGSSFYVTIPKFTAELIQAEGSSVG